MKSQTENAWMWSLRGSLACAALAFSVATALGQGLDCGRLQAQIASVRGDPGKAQRFQAAAQRQSQELNRTVSYARSIGCENRQFLFFGSPPPAQCPQINGRIQRMQANLQQLQQQAASSSGEAIRRSLTARYDAYCRGGTQASLQRPRSFFEQLFGGGSSAPPPEEIPVNPDRGPAPNGPGDDTARGGSKAVCVRTCDGGFFPVSYAATRSKLPELQQQCQALCPNVATELFTYPGSGVIDQAVSIDGKPYSSLPNADRFRTHFDAACTCRPPHESWAQALAGAERLTGDRRSDIIVTPEKSEEMSRPTGANSSSKAGKSPKGRLGASGGDSDDSRPALDADSAAGAAAVGDDSADISGYAVKGKAYGEKDGRVVEETGPNGVKERVRIVGPQF